MKPQDHLTLLKDAAAFIEKQTGQQRLALQERLETAVRELEGEEESVPMQCALRNQSGITDPETKFEADELTIEGHSIWALRRGHREGFDICQGDELTVTFSASETAP